MTDPTYTITHDGTQWQLTRTAEKVNPETGEITESTRTEGYFPKFSQAIRKMYEAAVGDKIRSVDLAGVVAAVEKAEALLKTFDAVQDCKDCILR